MASYTDNIPQFKPYVQQLPVEAMTQVGMQKQRQYDEGYQRIQSQIDKVAGLSVMRDVDKQYLQSKMGQLGNSLRMVSMGDFSNYQLVNQVGGMVSQVGKDEKIQNAVISTANAQKQQKAMEDAKTKGEWGPENEHDYQKKFSKYMNSPTVGERFTDQYTPYTDVNKKIIAIAKEVGLDEKSIQSLYATDINGNPLTYKEDTIDALGKHKAGDIQWNPVMVEKHLKGKDPAKILDAFQTALTPQDYNQLAITGRYLKYNYTPEKLKEEIMNVYSSDISSISGKIEDLKINKASEEAKNDKDAEKIVSIDKQLEIFQNRKLSLEKAQKNDLATVDIDPDAVKANLYTNSYLTRMARSLSSMTEEMKYSVSPQFEVTMKLNEFNRSLQRDKIADQHWAVEQQRADKKLTWEMEKEQTELLLKYPNGVGRGNSGLLPGPIDTKGGAMAIVAAVKDNYIAKTQDLNANNYKIVKEYFKKSNPNDSDEQLSKKIFDYAASKGKPFTAGSEDVNEVVANLAAQQVDEWKKNPTKVPFELRGLIEKQYSLTKTLSIEKERLKKIKEQAYQKASELGEAVPTEAEIYDKINPTTIQIIAAGQSGYSNPQRESVNLSREDMINLANLYPDVFNIFGKFTIDRTQEAASKSARNRLLTKYGPEKLSRIVSETIGGYVSSQDITDPNFNIGTSNARNPELQRTGKLIHGSNYQRLAEIEAQLYLDNNFVKQPLVAPVLRDKDNKDDVNSKIVQIIHNYRGNLNEIEGFDAEAAKAIVLSGKDNAVTTLATPEIDGSVSYTMTIHGVTGTSQTMKISESEWSYITKRPPLSNDDAPQVLQQIDLYGTSGHEGKTTKESAWFESDKFENLKGTNYSATGNLIPDANNPNLLWFKLYVTDNNTKKSDTLTYDAPIPKIVDGRYNQTLDALPRAINPAVIKGLIKKQN